MASAAEFERLLKEEGRYVSGARRGRGLNALPGITPLRFYTGMIGQVMRARWRFGKGISPADCLVRSAADIFAFIEALGGHVEIAGVQHLHGLDGPAVIVGNHMSSLETFVLPGIVLPFTDVTFVLKEVLLDYPMFGTMLKQMECIAVTRTDPRADLRTVFEKGGEALAAGRSVIIFPQTTRTATVDPDEFNSLGIKLAARAGVPIVPVAVKTDIWGNGKLIKDLGPVRPDADVHIEFGTPMTIEGKGRDQHAACVSFICGQLQKWTDNVQSDG